VNARQLQSYLVQQVLQHQDDIAPEILTDYVGGDSKTAIDASIQKAKQASAALVQRALQSQHRPHDQDDPGPSFVTQIREGYGDQPLTAEAIAALSLEDYGKLRAQLGIDKAKDQGLFAGLR
jgi:hypothetical protein